MLFQNKNKQNYLYTSIFVFFPLVGIINVFFKLLHEKKPCYNKCIYMVFPECVTQYEQDYFSLILQFQSFLHSMILHMMESIDIYDKTRLQSICHSKFIYFFL